MRVFLIISAISLFLVGLAAMVMPVEAQVFPATLTPFPTFDLNYDSPAQATMAREITNTIWWENAPVVVGSPRPGFVMYIIQMYRWVNDTTNQLIIYSLLLIVVVIIVLRMAHTTRRWMEKSDGASIGGNEVTVTVDKADVEKFQ